MCMAEGFRSFHFTTVLRDSTTMVLEYKMSLLRNRELKDERYATFQTYISCVTTTASRDTVFMASQCNS
jgi:hypothetical protein